MKKLILIPFILMSVIAFSQTVVSSNPYIVDPSSTSTFEVNLGGRNTVFNPNASAKYWTTILITVPSTNAGSVQWNSVNSTMTNTPSISAGSSNQTFMITIKDKIYFKFSNASDVVHITII